MHDRFKIMNKQLNAFRLSSSKYYAVFY